MSARQMYAVPVSPWALNDSDLGRLRQRLAEAEKVAAQSRDWRAEQDAREIRRELGRAETEIRLEHERERRNRPVRNAGHVTNVARAVEQGRYLMPVPYWVTPKAPPAVNVENTKPTFAEMGEVIEQLRAAGALKGR